jgi:hypothetical protein
MKKQTPIQKELHKHLQSGKVFEQDSPIVGLIKVKMQKAKINHRKLVNENAYVQ